MSATTYTIKYDAYTNHVQGLTTRLGKDVCGALSRSGSFRTGHTLGSARAVKAELDYSRRTLCRVCATALELTIKWELEDERVAAGLPAPEYDRPYSVQFSQTQMKINYRDDEGVDKTELFELHRTRPEGLFHLVRSVQDVNGRTWEYGFIMDSRRFVAWPYAG